MTVLTDIGFLATCRDADDQGCLHSIRDAIVVWSEGRFEWVGPARDLPDRYAREPHVSAGGMTVAPGLIDSHTHLAFGGWRADEFKRRLEGESYLDIARSGGGIMRTVAQTRRASRAELVEHCLFHLERMAELGVTTVECKSGYGLTVDEELKILRAYRDAADRHAVELVSTVLAAHVNPDPNNCNNDCYISKICDELLPQVQSEGLATFNDVFVEESAFTLDDARKVLEAGRDHGLTPKLHVDQLGDSGGAPLAASLSAASADHLEYTGPDGIQALAEAGVVAGCLPLATLYLKQRPMDAHAFVEAGVPVAVATDFNPGSAPSYDIHLACMLACTLNGLTPAESLKGATIVAARSIGKEDQIGSIEPGKRADLCILDTQDIDQWLYHFRPNRCVATIVQGKQIAGSELPATKPESRGRCM